MVEVIPPQEPKKWEKQQLITDLEPEVEIEDIFAISNLSSPQKYKNKSGQWFSFKVNDSSGSIEVKFWGGPDETITLELYKRLKVGQVVLIKGRATKAYRGDGLEIVIGNNPDDCIVCMQSDDYDCTSFVRATERRMGDMLKELSDFVDAVTESNLKALLTSFFDDPNFMRVFVRAPAGKMYHNPWVGGLIEHTLAVTRTCKSISDIYPNLDRDLLITGALLHDIGKVYEYEITTSIELTDNALLRGHVVTGAEMVSRKCAALGIDESLAARVEHLILASHGQPQYGSPLYPCIPEGAVLSCADDLDAKIAQFDQAKEDSNEGVSFVWSKQLGRFVLVK